MILRTALVIGHAGDKDQLLAETGSPGGPVGHRRVAEDVEPHPNGVAGR
jgi:hypothetical protein